MRIAVNTRLLLKDKLEGIGWFTYETLKRITQTHPEHEFLFIFDRPYSNEFIFSSNVKPIVAYPQARHPFLWYLFFEYSIPYILKKHKADIFVSTDGWISLNIQIPIVNVIHDLNFVHYPEFIAPILYRKYCLKYFPLFAEKSTHIATVSEFTKQDIVQLYKQSPDKIDVVYNGVNTCYQPISEEEKQLVREQFTQGCAYFVFVGAIHQRKNLSNLFRAFDVFREKTTEPVKLLIVGEKKWWGGEIANTYEAMQYKTDVVFAGRLDPKMLNVAVAASVALTYVSFFEGFGIPIIEAFHAETAVITSNCTSMPEVAADAALFIDPYQPQSIADAMFSLYTNSNIRESLIEKGRIRRQFFSWDLSAIKLWQTIEKVMTKK